MCLGNTSLLSVRNDEVPLNGVVAILKRMISCSQTDARGVFDSQHVPDIPLEHYLESWKRSGCSTECFIFVAIYISRCSYPVTPSSIHRLVLAALVVACKFRDDFCYSNVVYANLGGVSLHEMNRLEAALLLSCGWNMEVSPQQFTETLALCQEEELKMKNTSVLMPSQFTSVLNVVRSDQKESLGLLFDGTRVVGVVPGSPAHRAGMQRNTIIVSVNRTVCESAKHLLSLLMIGNQLVIQTRDLIVVNY